MVAEDHGSNPIKIALGKLKAKGVKIVAVNPVRTGYGAIADEWIGIRPGTDGLFVGSLIYELMRSEKIDLDYLVRFTNAHWLVIDDAHACLAVAEQQFTLSFARAHPAFDKLFRIFRSDLRRLDSHDQYPHDSSPVQVFHS